MKKIGVKDRFMEEALIKAEKSITQGGGPIGAVIVKNDVIIASGISAGNILLKPYAHAEHMAIDEACSKLGVKKLNGCVLYSSLEPCLMCLGLIYWAGIREVIYACRKETYPFYYETNLHIDAITDAFLEKMDCAWNENYEGQSKEIIDLFLKNK